VAAGPVLHLDDPEIGVELQFTRKALLDLRFRDEAVRHGGEAPVAGTRFIEGGLRRRGVERGGAVELRDLHKDGASLFRAAPADDREGAFQMAAADVSRNPDGALETQGPYSTGAPVTVASSFRRRSPISPVLPRPRSRSKRSMAPFVSASAS